MVKEFGLAVLDVNHLKKVNDFYGHEKGNALLINASRLVCSIFEHSPVFRLGGDEFAVILTNGDYQIRDELIQKLKTSMKELESKEQPWEQVSIRGPFFNLVNVTNAFYHSSLCTNSGCHLSRGLAGFSG